MWFPPTAGCPPHRPLGKFPSGSVGSYIRMPLNHHGDEPAGEQKHVMFQFSSKCSQQDPFPFLLEKLPNGNIQNEILCFGVAGREEQVITRPNGAEHFSGMSCQESERSPALNGALCSLLT